MSDSAWMPEHGSALDGSDVVDRTRASPIFHAGDYSATPAVTGPDSAGHIAIVAGGELSRGNIGVRYEYAIPRRPS